MTPEQYALVEAIFSAACELAEPERTAFVERRAAGDPLVRREVEAMLAADDADDGDSGLSVAAWPHARDITLVDADEAGRRALSLPERIGRYRILRECGHGGMGVVYEAEQESLRRRVALKVIRTGAVSGQLQRRFRHEVEVLGRLQHPGIAQVYEAGGFEEGEGGQPYFAMEFVDGLPLLEYARVHELDTRARLELFARVCDAVQYAHEKGVIHRDLKPDNVLVVHPTDPSRASGSGAPGSSTATRGGTPPAATTGSGDGAGDGRPKILDFGVARIADADVLMTTMATGVGQLIGTIQYMSPEQTTGSPGALGTRSDIYALGVVLFELLGGRLPYDLRGRSIPDSVRIIQEVEPDHLGSIDRTLRGDIDTIVGKCLEKEPGRRYASAADVAEDIRRHLRDEPILARPPSSWHQFAKFSRRNRALVGGTLATLLALLVGLVTSLTFAKRAQENARLATEKEALAQRQAYVARLTAANALAGTDPQLAAEQLEATPATLRGWEWRYLSSLLQRSAQTYDGEIRSRTDAIPYLLSPAFTSGAPRLVAPLADGRVAVWSPDRAEIQQVGEALVGEDIRAFAVPRDGPPLAACGTTGGRVAVWDIDGDRWFDVPAIEGPIWELAWDAMGRRLLILTPSCIRLWGDGAPIRDHVLEHPIEREPARDVPTTLGFSRDGTRFFAIVPVDGGRELRVWNAETGARALATDETAIVEAAARSRDGSRFALPHSMRACIVKDAETSEPLCTLRGHAGFVRAIAWTTDDTRILTSSVDGTIRMWQSGNGDLLDVIRAEPGSPLAIAPNGAGVVYQREGRLQLWDFAPPRAIALEPDVSYVYNLVFSPDSQRLAAASTFSEYTTLIDPIAAKVLATVRCGRTDALVFSPDGAQLHAARTIDLDTLESPRAATVEQLDSPLTERARAWAEWPLADRRGRRSGPGAAVSPDGTRLATAVRWNRPGDLVVSEIATGKVVLENAGSYWGVAFSPDGEVLAAAAELPGSIEIWSLERRERILELPAHGTHVYCVDFHPDGTRLASGGNDGVVRIWDTATWEPLLDLRGHAAYVKALTFSPDGTQLASGSGDLTVRLWDTVPRAERHRQSMAAGRR